MPPIAVTCAECDLFFPSKARRAKHRRDVHWVSCSGCGNKFESAKTVARHSRKCLHLNPSATPEATRALEMIPEERPDSQHKPPADVAVNATNEVPHASAYPCQKCEDITFPTEQGFNVHQALFHGIVPPGQDVPDSSVAGWCDWYRFLAAPLPKCLACQVVFENDLALEKHVCPFVQDKREQITSWVAEQRIFWSPEAPPGLAFIDIEPSTMPSSESPATISSTSSVAGTTTISIERRDRMLGWGVPVGGTPSTKPTAAAAKKFTLSAHAREFTPSSDLNTTSLEARVLLKALASAARAHPQSLTVGETPRKQKRAKIEEQMDVSA